MSLEVFRPPSNEASQETSYAFKSSPTHSRPKLRIYREFLDINSEFEKLPKELVEAAGKFMSIMKSPAQHGEHYFATDEFLNVSRIYIPVIKNYLLEATRHFETYKAAYIDIWDSLHSNDSRLKILILKLGGFRLSNLENEDAALGVIDKELDKLRSRFEEPARFDALVTAALIVAAAPGNAISLNVRM